MKKTIFLLFCSLILNFSKIQAQSSLHTYTALAIDSSLINFSNYFGKKILIVNTASYCGYTPQYTDLQQLYQNYKQYNFEILGFPCNDFGAQEPGKDSLINSFCTTNYGVTFQMMRKIAIIAGDTAPVYKWLQKMQLNGVSNASVSWNFNKFLINECGQWVAYLPSTTNPLDTAITNWIMKPSCILTGVNALQNNLNSNVELISENPSNQYISFLIKQPSNLPYVFNLYSIDGKLIRNLSTKISTNFEKLGFNISEINPGLYFIKIHNGEVQKTIKIIVGK